MKTKFFLLLGICCLALTACGSDDNGDDPAKPLDNAKISFTKMANCPNAEVDEAIVWKNAIYYVNSNSFICYNPSKNEWKSLAPAPAINIFVWQNKLYCHNASGNSSVASNIHIYSDTNNTWQISNDIALPSFNSGNAITTIKSIENKLFAVSYSGHSHVITYLPDSREWQNENTIQEPVIINPTCQIEGKTYYIYSNIIYQFDPETYVTTQKVNIPQQRNTTLAVCQYNQEQMLYIYSSGTNEKFRITIGIYTPSTNEYSERDFASQEGIGVSKAEIPMIINKLTYIDGRIFAGPNNAAFYELKFK